MKNKLLRGVLIGILLLASWVGIFFLGRSFSPEPTSYLPPPGGRPVQAKAPETKADWLSKINRKILGNTVFCPYGTSETTKAVFAVDLASSGEILKVVLKTSSGHTQFDQAIERAILKSSPLPKTEKPELFVKNIELGFPVNCFNGS